MNRSFCHILLITAILGFSAACTREQETGSTFPIAFKADAGVSASTKAGGTLLKDFSVTSFYVVGTKVSGSTPTLVMDGFDVIYDGGWKYADVNGQDLQYWDFHADQYRFSAAAGGSISSGKARFTGATTAGKNFVALEQNNTIDPAEFGRIVNLQFSRLLSRVRVAFYEDMEDWSVKNLTCTLSGAFIDRADYAVTLSGGAFTVDNITSSPSLPFSLPATIGASRETASMTGFTEVLPSHNNSGITLTITGCTYVDSEGTEYDFNPGTAIVIPSDMLEWDINHSYTYVFRLSESEVTLDMVIALSIHDWEGIDNETILE